MSFGSTITRYLVALAATLCAYACYATLIAPRIEGTQQVSRATVPEFEVHRPGIDIKRKLIGLLPDDGWEWKPCKILETPQGILLFQDYQPMDDGAVLLEPLSMIVGLSVNEEDSPDNARPPPPFVLRAPQGAALKFDQPLSLSGNLGRLVQGQLNGEVQIYRMASSDARDDSLALVTQNVQISPERIFTLYDVTFRFGQSRGRGKHLVIDLAKSSSPAIPQSTFAGIEKVELAQVDQMYLHRENGRAASQSDDLLGDENRSLNISCQGPFVFNFRKRFASFSQQVSVSAADRSGDRLTCDRLVVDFAEKELPVDQSGPDEKTLAVRISKMVATGWPAVLTARSQNAQAVAERLEYNLTTQEVWLKSRGQVSLTRDGQRIESPEIRYTFTDDGRLGTAVLTGPGILEQMESAGQDSLVCRWRDQFSLQDDDGQKVVTLDGARVSSGGMSLASHQMHLWLWEIPRQSSEDFGDGQQGKSRWTFVPAKLFADGQVTITSDQLEGKCGEAAAYWPKPTIVSQMRNERQAHMVLRTATQHRTSAQQPQQWRSTLAIKPTQPAGRAQPGPSAFASTAYQEPATPKKVRFVGNQVQLQMQGGDDFSVIDELTVDGDVVVQQFDAAIPNESTLELRGQKLRAISTADDLYRLIVSGGEPQPASVVSRGLSLTGPVIQLDQVANRLWVDGPGEMQMASTANRAPQESAGFAAGGQTHVQWRGGMVFDGQNVYFESNVKSNTRQESDETGTTTVTITESAALSLILNTRFDFRKSSNSVNQSTFDVTSMVMVGELETGEARFVESLANDGREELIAVTSQYDLAGKLISSRQIRAPRAEFDKRSGQANCAGPGSLTIRQLAKSGPAGLTAAPRSSAQPAANARISAVSRHHRAIDYVKIEFERSLRGNFEQNQLTFQGNVHAHYDGIDDWNDSPAGRRLSDSGMILDCDQLVLAQWTSSSETEPNVEMIATGDARAKGSQFEAVAERISYDQRADRVVVEAPTRGNAELWSQRRGQSKRDHLVAQKILYRLADGTFEVQKAKQIEYSQQEPVRKK